MSARSQCSTAAAAALLTVMLSASAVDALTPLTSLRYAPDITVALDATTVDHNEVAEDNLAGLVMLVSIGAIPSTTIVTAYDRLPSGQQLLAFDTDVSLAGGISARPGDVVQFNGVTFTLLFDADANGVPRGVILDALAAIGPSDLLLSFDVPVTLGTLLTGNRDVIRFHDGAFSLYFDSAAAGIAAGVDLDALYLIQSNGHLLVSFDISGTVGGVVFDDDDVLEYSPESDTWELTYNGSAADSGWTGADLQALSAVTASAQPPVPPAIGDPPPGSPGGNTIFPGSRRVSGRGTPRAVPGDTCIAIYSVGPNGNPDVPPGSVDDVLLGIGGTDESGAFVAVDGSPGIPIYPPLQSQQRIFAVDVCSGQTGGVFIVTTPVPALGPWQLLVALVLLIAVAGARFRAAARHS